MIMRHALLNNQKALALVTLFCLIETVWSWASIARGVRHRVDIITALFSPFLKFIAVSIAYRSSFWADRIVFGAMAAASALIAVRAASLPPTAMFALYVAYAFMWTIAATVGLVILVLGLRAGCSGSQAGRSG
jgi:hypothetical protein